MNDPLTGELARDKRALQEYFGNTVDFYAKDICICGFACCICMFEGLSGIERLWNMLLESLAKPEAAPATPEALFAFLQEKSDLPLESQPAGDLDTVRVRLTSGASVVLIDGCRRALVLSTQSMQYRSVQEPSGESNLRGSREGFTEPLRVNISLVRRLIRTDALKVETLFAGRRTRTEIALLYDPALVPPKLLEVVRARVQAAQLPFVFDTGYLAPFLQKGAFSFFPAVGYTERPDTAAAKICEGKLVVMANGTPFALIAPYLFSENFQSMDDYAQKAYFASCIRLLKYAAFFIAVMLPGLFVSAADFVPELLPAQLLYKVAAAEQGTPLPLFAEMLLVNFLLEIVREAGLRMPKPIGHSVGLVAALIVGDAAVSAGLLGTPTVITGALTAICSFVVPSLYEPVIVLRVLFILAGGLLGPLGIVTVLLCMLLGMCDLRAFGVPYTAPLSPFSKAALRDGVLRSTWQRLARADFTLQDLPQAEDVL